MGSHASSNKEKKQEKSKSINSNDKFKNLKSDYFIDKIFSYISKGKSLDIIKYNRSIQKRINININNYKEYSEKYSSIELEIIPRKYGYSSFINIKYKETNIIIYIIIMIKTMKLKVVL